jgi:hypothetical protein
MAGQGWKGFQFNHFVRQTDLLYKDLWVQQNGSMAGMWAPSYWVRSRFQAQGSGAQALKTALMVGPSAHRTGAECP